MNNMGYIRFENTLKDLRDCFDHMDSEDLSPTEYQARSKLIRLCVGIANDYGDALDDDSN